MDREKVIEAWENVLSHDPLDVPWDLLDETLKLLKEQEPVEPSVDVDTYVCPNCGHRLEHQGMLGDNVIFDERYNFCPACGKAVKWK